MKPVSVLLIEDNPADARLIREILAESPDGAVSLAREAALAVGLEVLGRGGADVVLLDLGLPDSTGLDTLAAVQRQFPSIPVVVMTGLADGDMAAQAVRAGAQDYLVKGQVDNHGLRRSLAYAVERKQLLLEKDRLIVELQDALTKVKTLTGLLPICANCKKIRDDTGYWQQVESYIQKHSEAVFSHGICPDCARTIYPDLFPDSPAGGTKAATP